MRKEISSLDGGEKQEKVEYHNIVAWSKLADICGQLLHKGDKVYVEGRIQTREWKGDDGSDRKITEIVIDNMMLLSSSSGRSGAGAGCSNGSDDQSATSAPAKSSKSKKAALDAETDSSDELSDDLMPESDVSSVEDVADDIPF